MHMFSPRLNVLKTRTGAALIVTPVGANGKHLTKSEAECSAYLQPQGSRLTFPRRTSGALDLRNHSN